MKEIASGDRYYYASTPHAFGEVAQRILDELPLPSCTLEQSASFTDGALTLAYTVGALEPTTWHLGVIVNGNLVPLAGAELPVIDPPFTTEEFSFPFPSLGAVDFVTALTTPTTGVICVDLDVVDTGTPPETPSDGSVPSLSVPISAAFFGDSQARINSEVE